MCSRYMKIVQSHVKLPEGSFFFRRWLVRENEVHQPTLWKISPMILQTGLSTPRVWPRKSRLITTGRVPNYLWHHLAKEVSTAQTQQFYLYLSLYLSISLFVYLSTSQSLNLSIARYLSIYPSIYLSIWAGCVLQQLKVRYMINFNKQSMNPMDEDKDWLNWLIIGS